MHIKLGNYYAKEAFFFRVTNIDSKHDAYINQEVFPVKEK